MLNQECPLHVVSWADGLNMLFGLFRKFNVQDPATRFDPGKHLCRSDIIVHHWGLQVIIKWSKTLQFRECNVSVLLPYTKGHPLCPTTAVVLAFSLTSAAPLHGPALTYPTLSGVQPLRYPQFVKMLREFLKDIGLPAQMFVGHSFRRGGASFAMQAGLPGEIIMQLGQLQVRSLLISTALMSLTGIPRLPGNDASCSNSISTISTRDNNNHSMEGISQCTQFKHMADDGFGSIQISIKCVQCCNLFSGHMTQ